MLQPMIVLVAAMMALGQPPTQPLLNQRGQGVETPGREPRRKVRYMPPLGTAYTVRVTLSESSGFDVNGKKQPAEHSPEVIVVLRGEAVDYRDNGGTQMEFAIGEIDVNPRQGSTRAKVDATRVTSRPTWGRS